MDEIWVPPQIYFSTQIVTLILMLDLSYQTLKSLVLDLSYQHLTDPLYKLLNEKVLL